MKSASYKNRVGGFIRISTTDEPFKCYVPKALPPIPAVDLNSLAPLLERAQHALGILDGASIYSPNIDIFLYSYVRKEALLSSQIEGTQSTLSDLLLFESEVQPGVPLADVEEVSNYIAALKHGISRLQVFPMSLRLIREIHKILLKGTRGKDKEPGEFRRTQNWIGGSRPSRAVFVPPPPTQMHECLNDLEKFFHEKHKLPTLIKIALIHVQFETIHPFLDGNGRIGRLLITLLLIHEQQQKQPLLYLSLYFKKNREQYYLLLQKVRTQGTWEEWVEFFLNAVIESAEQATKTIEEGLRLFENDNKTIKKLGVRRFHTPDLIHRYMQKHVITTVGKASKDLGLTPMTVTKALLNLCDLKIILEITGKSRGRVFVYKKYLMLLDEGTEPFKD